MYTQVFGNYLLNTGMVTTEQLLSAISTQSSARVNLGTLAIHKGYMTASEAERIFILQTHQDKRFGELAVEEGYLTSEQVTELLQSQVPGYVLLGQVLIDQGVVSATQMQNIVTDYCSEFEIDDLEEYEEQSDLVHHLLTDIDSEEEDTKEYINEYLLLLFNNLIRFIGDDFTPLNVIKIPEVPTERCTSQSLDCPAFHVESALNMESATAVEFASRYAQDQFTEFDDYVRASMEDFLNLHNGLFVVNMSNDFSLEVTLDPPVTQDDSLFSLGESTYIFPIMFPFGIVHFICSVHSNE
ncbi:MAG: chemotaxis protein CheX [Lachnospiraceae bacterium]|jgi:hypothetical protein|nr:chemotaxis protein CheX [Lachnospiraceae bacterium]